MAVARRFVVSGRVQGVGFRYFVVQSAGPLNISGYVRNMPNGTVEVVAEGPEEDLRILAQKLRRGPRYGRVDRVDSSDLTPGGGYTGFDVRY